MKSRNKTQFERKDRCKQASSLILKEGTNKERYK